jgi:MFS family permease
VAKRSFLLIGISVLWLPLSMLFDGLNSLILPAYLLKLNIESNQASWLGLITFTGLIAGMLIQTIAGTYSDRLRSRWGRRGIISVGLILLLPLILVPEVLTNAALLFLVYLLIQFAANIVQAGLQGFIPDLVKAAERGMASGIKNLMDIGGALLVFIVLAQLFGEGRAELVLPLIAGVFLFAYLLTVLFVREPMESSAGAVPHPNLSAIFQFNFREHRDFAWLIVSRFLFLLGTYAVGRFLLFFVAERLELGVNRAGEQTASILAILSLITVAAAPLAGWIADKVNRRWLMIFGGLSSALGVVLLMTAQNFAQILVFGSLMALGSAAFSAANWALSADFAPREEAGRFLALANFGTVGAAAAAGIFGPVIDFGNQFGSGTGYSLLFVAAAAAFLLSSLAVQRIEIQQALSDVLEASMD